MKRCSCGSCYLCKLYESDPRYNALWSEPPANITFPERVYLLNLKRRPDRLESSLSQLRREGVEPIVYEAIDGSVLPFVPGWESAGMGAYGCLEGHKRMLEECIKAGVQSVLIFEDDINVVTNFKSRLLQALSVLPEDWQGLFLGGQHVSPPERTERDGIIRALNCHRTHAYILRGEYIKTMYSIWAAEKGHCDQVWSKHQPDHRMYAVEDWLVAQGTSKSDINGRMQSERWWRPRRFLPSPKREIGPTRKCTGCK